jgi:hypothetical protein
MPNKPTRNENRSSARFIRDPFLKLQLECELQKIFAQRAAEVLDGWFLFRAFNTHTRDMLRYNILQCSMPVCFLDGGYALLAWK